MLRKIVYLMVQQLKQQRKKMHLKRLKQKSKKRMGWYSNKSKKIVSRLKT